MPLGKFLTCLWSVPGPYFYLPLIAKRSAGDEVEHSKISDGKHDIIDMFHDDRPDVSEGININKTNNSHECLACHFCYFFKINFSYQPLVYNHCHDTMERSITIYALL